MFIMVKLVNSLRSFPTDTYNSVRAYLIVLNTVTEQTDVFYSQNYTRNPEQLGGAGSYTTGFEDATKAIQLQV